MMPQERVYPVSDVSVAARICLDVFPDSLPSVVHPGATEASGGACSMDLMLHASDVVDTPVAGAGTASRSMKSEESDSDQDVNSDLDI